MSGDKRGREAFGVKIVTWNINGIRSLYNENRNLKNVLDSLDADIICLQETKITSKLDTSKQAFILLMVLFAVMLDILFCLDSFLLPS